MDVALAPGTTPSNLRFRTGTMATTATPTPESAAPGAAPASGGAKLILIGAFAGLVLGGATGAFVIAPRLGHAAPEEVVIEESHNETPAAPAAVHQIENLVINPANTNGSRFLLVTTTVVVKNAAAVEELAARDAEIRDRIVDFLSAQSVEQLSDPARRETLKADLASAISSLFAAGVVTRVLLPQFVIQ